MPEVAVFEERRELGPPLGAFEQCGLAHLDATKLRGEGECDDVHRREDLIELGGVVAHGSIMPLMRRGAKHSE
jgi:hypothetical protein